jgi:predicted RNA-binding Zn ribbon-like protein
VDGIFRPLAGGSRPPDRFLLALREAEREALARAELRPAGASFLWSWPERDELEAPLWPLAPAAIELLTTGALGRLTLCGQCRWFFLDASKNRSRRWCSMGDCGTAVKKRRYVERRRARRLGSRR